MSRSRRQSKLQPSRTTVVVVGLGYVGLPLACLAAEKGYRVIGLDRDAAKVARIRRGLSPMKDRELSRWLKRVRFEATTDPSVLASGHIIVLCVPTPVDHAYNPDLRPLRAATRDVRTHLRRGQLIILESTVNPGVTEEVVQPMLERSGLRAGRDFSLAFCPERVNPGDRRWTVRNIPRVVGATDTRGRRRVLAFYRSIIEAEVKPLSTIRAAEATKILENTFRDVNIAFMNEMAQSFARLGIDVTEVIAGASTKPFAFLPHYPSCGIGGHCIPVDPYYLIERARRGGFNHRFLKLAREINNGMPAYTVKLLAGALRQIRRPLRGAKVGLLGLAYKADIDDTRESPSFVIAKLLRQRGAKVLTFDPHVPSKSNQPSLRTILSKADALILATAHREFLRLTPAQLRRSGIKVVVDGKNAWSPDALRRAGIIYRGIGR